jgi:cytoskeletal protein CcmA (bactofilin family)
MASSYTGNSGIEKPADGDQSGSWGDTINTNMDIIDRSINGVGAITLSGTTHTLTTTDGTLSDGMYKVLVLGGSPSGTNTITIAPNDADKVYIVVNSSGQTATFTQGSGANVSVLNGDSKIIYADGAGSGAAVVDITADLSFSSVNIDGGTIDGTVIGGASAAAGTFTTVTASGEIDGASLDISGNADIDGTLETDALSIASTTVTSTAAELNYNDTGAAVGTVVASKTVTADANKDVASFRNITLTGELDAGSLDISGDADIDGTLETDALSIASTAVTATAAEINYLDITTLGTSEASKAVTVDSSGDLIVPDSDKFKFGAGSDMQLYHDGTNSYITNGTGILKIATETSGIAINIGHGTSEVTFGDNVTVTGDFTVNGTTTTINTTNLTVTDPLVKYGQGYTGTAYDEGFIITRGNGSATNTANKGFIWDESADEFAAIACNTEDGTTAGNVTINSYADLQVDKLTGGSLDISGDADIDGTLEADAMTLNGTAITTTATLSTGISNTNVPVFTSGVADDDFLRVAGTSIEGRSAAEVLSDIGASAVAGSSSIVTTGALNSGSITSGFGTINNGSSTITTSGVVTSGSLLVGDAGTIGSASDTDAVAISSAGQVSFSATNAIKVPVGTTAQRPSNAAGLIRYNSTLGQFEGYTSAWGGLGGGATGGGADQVFVENSDDVTTNYTITSGKNAMSVGPITVESGVVVTIPSGSRWVVL